MLPAPPPSPVLQLPWLENLQGAKHTHPAHSLPLLGRATSPGMQPHTTYNSTVVFLLPGTSNESVIVPWELFLGMGGELVMVLHLTHTHASPTPSSEIFITHYFHTINWTLRGELNPSVPFWNYFVRNAASLVKPGQFPLFWDVINSIDNWYPAFLLLLNTWQHTLAFSKVSHSSSNQTLTCLASVFWLHCVPSTHIIRLLCSSGN